MVAAPPSHLRATATLPHSVWEVPQSVHTRAPGGMGFLQARQSGSVLLSAISGAAAGSRSCMILNSASCSAVGLGPAARLLGEG